MKLKTITLAAAIAATCSFAYAQALSNTARGSSQAGSPAASKTTTGYL